MFVSNARGMPRKPKSSCYLAKNGVEGHATVLLNVEAVTLPRDKAQKRKDQKTPAEIQAERLLAARQETLGSVFIAGILLPTSWESVLHR